MTDKLKAAMKAAIVEEIERNGYVSSNTVDGDSLVDGMVNLDAVVDAAINAAASVTIEQTDYKKLIDDFGTACCDAQADKPGATIAMVNAKIALTGFIETLIKVAKP